jgi:sugar O-acyltransferase (sialic acid O-acetyltransferase NeuD family)
MRLAILGAGGHGRVVAESAAMLGWDVNFFDDVRSGSVDGWSVSGRAADVFGADQDAAIVAVGDNSTRLDWLLRLHDRGVAIATIIDSAATVSSSAKIGPGSFVARGAVVSTGSNLSRGCIVNTSATVDHDCLLAEAVHLSPGVHLSGNVRIGERSWLGTGSSVRNNITIGQAVIVGVGSAVVRDIGDGQIVAGVPARPLERY